MSSVVGNDDFLRNYPCPNCGVRGQVVWEAISGIYACRHCRVGGFQPFPEEPEVRRPARPNSSTRRQRRENRTPDFVDSYEVVDGAETRRIVVQYHVPIDPEPPQLRDPNSEEWQETWGNFVRWERADIIAQERRVERDRMRRRGVKPPKRR